MLEKLFFIAFYSFFHLFMIKILQLRNKNIQGCTSVN